MRIVRHSAYIKKQKRNAKLFAALGFIVLTSSMLFAVVPRMLIFAYVAMIMGFIAFNVGMQGIGKWTRKNRNDEIIDFRLKGLNNRYTVIHYAQIGQRVIEHMLVHPGGVLVMAARELDGAVQQRGVSWRRGGGMITRMFRFSGPQLGNPSLDNDRALETLDAWLAEQGIEAETFAATTFLDPRVKLSITDPDYPVLLGEELPDFVHDLTPDADFTADDQSRIVELLSAGADVSEPERAQVSSRPRPVRRVAAPKSKAQAKKTEPEGIQEPKILRRLRERTQGAENE